MAEILLINRDTIFKFTSLKGNLDPDKLYPHIKTSQDIHLQTIIGTKLLNKLKALVTAGTMDDAGNEYYKALNDDYIAPLLVYYCMVDFIPFNVYEISNGGVFKHAPENANTLEAGEVSALVGKFKDKAEFYARRLEDYICANSSQFTEYSQPDNGDLPSSGASTFHGWVI